MGRKGNWFSAMKKALNPEAKEQIKNQETGKSKKKWFRKKRRSGSNTPPVETAATATTATTATTTAAATTATTLPPEPTTAPVVATPEAEKISSSAENKEHTKHAYTVAVATAKAAEAAVAAAEAAAEVVRLTAAASPLDDKSKEEVAAIKIQTAFRGYMARRTVRVLRGLERLKTVLQGKAIKYQTANTLKSMQTLARVQSQMHERRQRMAEENVARQKQIQHNYEKEQAKELDKSKQGGDGWDSSGKTKEQIEAKRQSRHEAAIRRERTLAYAFTHQQAWKASSMSAQTLFMDVNNPHWGWSWLERWLAARPWETAEKDLSNESSPRTKISFSGNHDLPKAAYKHPRSSTAGRLSTSSATSKPTSAGRKLRTQSPKVSPNAGPRKSMWGHIAAAGDDDDARSTKSMQSEQESRRNSVTGSSSARDDESLESCQTLPSYMAPTEATRARSRLGVECKREKSVTPDRVSVSSATNKRASHPASPAKSRRSASSNADAKST